MVPAPLKAFSRRSLECCKYRAKLQKVGPGVVGVPNIYLDF